MRELSIYSYQYLEHEPPNNGIKTRIKIQVQNLDCLFVAKGLLKKTSKNNICVLNMANQYYVGGDYLNFSRPAQEESLIHRTNLLDSLVSLKGIESCNVANPYRYNLPGRVVYTNAHQSSGMGELTCLFSKNVSVLHLTAHQEEGRESASAPFLINVISSAAYNLSDVDLPSPDAYLAGTVLKIINQLRVAKKNHQRYLVLGAFGCGAFGNDPTLIAEIYKAAIHQYEFLGCFDEIYFAIKSDSNQRNYEIFTSVFGALKYKSLYEILEPVLKTDASSSPSKNLLVKLKPFLYIQTQHELAYYAGLFLSVEIKLSKNNVERKQALSTLSFLINKNTDLTQVMLEHVLSTDYLSQHYKSTSMRSMFILTPYILIKIEKLMLRMSLNGPIFFREKEQIIKGLIRNIIVAKVQQTFNSCVNNEEKKVVSYLYYLAINKKPEDLKRELSLRFPDPVKNIFYRTLLSINAICQESGSMQRRAVGSVVKSSLERALIDNDVFIEKFSNAVAQHIEVVLTLNYSNFYTQAVFEEILHAHTHPHPHFFMREFL